MSEEEKIVNVVREQYGNFDNYVRDLLDLYDKQKRQIEELKNNELDYTTIYINGVYEGKKYYKDKIREKIKELDKKTFECKCSYVEYYYKKEVLKELLEE